MNKDAAIAYLDAHAQPHPTLHCARYVRLAIFAGGSNVSPWPEDAKDYGPYLLHCGFQSIGPENRDPERGDVVVIQPYPTGNAAGHIAMFDGKIWISDFRQIDFWVECAPCGGQSQAGVLTVC